MHFALAQQLSSVRGQQQLGAPAGYRIMYPVPESEKGGRALGGAPHRLREDPLAPPSRNKALCSTAGKAGVDDFKEPMSETSPQS